MVAEREREGPGRRCGRIPRWGLKFSATSAGFLCAGFSTHAGQGRAGHPFLPEYVISQAWYWSDMNIHDASIQLKWQATGAAAATVYCIVALDRFGLICPGCSSSCGQRSAAVLYYRSGFGFVRDLNWNWGLNKPDAVRGSPRFDCFMASLAGFRIAELCLLVGLCRANEGQSVSWVGPSCSLTHNCGCFFFFWPEMHVDRCLHASSSADAYNSPCPLISTLNVAHFAVCSL